MQGTPQKLDTKRKIKVSLSRGYWRKHNPRARSEDQYELIGEGGTLGSG